MKKLFIVANWKSNITQAETQKWFEQISNFQFPISNKQIIVCPSFTSLPAAHWLVQNQNFPIKLGAQNISQFDQGAYTGEVNGKQLSEFVKYVIIGHSERRKNFGETEEIINSKLEQALKFSLIPILCVSNRDQIKNSKVKMIVAYEPLSAIGTGNPNSPESADKMAQDIKTELGNIPVLYGGSVVADNVGSFTSQQNIDGVLVGGASLDQDKFLQIIHHA